MDHLSGSFWADLLSPGFQKIECDLKPFNLGLDSALRRATDRPFWRCIRGNGYALWTCHLMMMITWEHP